MKEWNRYVNKYFNKKIAADLLYSIAGESEHKSYPIIDASIGILKKLIEGGSLRNAIVFPEQRKMSFALVVEYVIQMILSDDNNQYNPDVFVPGECLGFGKARVRFEQIVTMSDGSLRLKLKLNDGTAQLKFENIPILQKVEEAPLSSMKLFESERSKAVAKLQKAGGTKNNIQNTITSTIGKLNSTKTRLTKSVCYVAQLKDTDSLVNTCLISDNTQKNIKFNDVVLVGKGNWGAILRLPKDSVEAPDSWLSGIYWMLWRLSERG